MDRPDYEVLKDLLTETVARYEAAIRLHRDQRGDDRCRLDDEQLYAALPEGYTPPERDTAVELERCRQYVECRRNPRTVYVSPQRRIEELEAEVKSLKKGIADAVAYINGGEVPESMHQYIDRAIERQRASERGELLRCKADRERLEAEVDKLRENCLNLHDLLTKAYLELGWQVPVEGFGKPTG